MSRNKADKQTILLVIKLFSLSALFLLQSACGGGGDDTAEANALGLQDIAIAFIKRPTPRDEQTGNVTDDDMSDPTSFTAGGDLYVQKSATGSGAAEPVNVTRRLTNGRGDVKDVNVSYDGTKLIFSLRLEDLTPNNQITPRWHIYEYNITSDVLTQLTLDGGDDGDDVSPNYLPDGRIIFSSNRQTKSKTIRSDEGRGSFIAVDENRNNAAFALHTLEADDSIKQISFNRSNDLDPIVLQNGRILFSRWNNSGTNNTVSLYTMKSDGTDVRLHYGAHSHNTGLATNTAAYSKPREMDDGRIMAILRPLATNFGGGEIVFIDTKNFVDNTQRVMSQQDNNTGTAQTIFKQNTTTSNGVPLAGRYNAIFPMTDGTGRYLMSWSPCRIIDSRTNLATACNLVKDQLNDANVVEAAPSYGIYIVDNNTQALLVKPQDDKLISAIVMVNPRKVPFDPSGNTIDTNLATNGIGILHIRSVYDFDTQFKAYGTTIKNTNGDDITAEFLAASPTKSLADLANPAIVLADQRPARFVRITKAVSFPNPIKDNNSVPNAAFGNGVQRTLGMQEIIGYAPVEPDGSVKVKVPANVPLSISVLDKDGRRLFSKTVQNRTLTNRHQSWFQVNPGETLQCIGCHVHDVNNQNTNKPHGRPYTSSFNEGAKTTGLPFPNSLTSLIADIGETMAQTRFREKDCPQGKPACGAMKPTADLIYTDEWTDETASNQSATPSFKIDYTDAPVNPLNNNNACNDKALNDANYDDAYDVVGLGPNSYTFCRVVINYQDHIQPIWSKDRGTDGANTCTGCHTTDGGTQVAAGQLELTNGVINNHYVSYRELLSNDREERLIDGELKDIFVVTDANGDTVFQTDANGDLILDINDQPIPETESFNVSASMSSNGANASRFMELMTGQDLNKNGSIPTVGLNPDNSPVLDHTGLLTDSELKLLSEWLDMGGQYFNNPFHVDALP